MHWKKEHGKVLAACDEDLVGKEIKEEERSMKVKESFYKGEKVTTERLEELLHDYENINLIGKDTVDTARDQGKIAETRKIKQIPYALIFTVNKKG